MSYGKGKGKGLSLIEIERGAVKAMAGWVPVWRSELHTKKKKNTVLNPRQES